MAEETKTAEKSIKINPKTNLIVRGETLKAFSIFQQRELVSRYNNYSKLMVREYLKKYQTENFWKTMQSAMLIHGHKLTSKDIIIGICDEFSDGVYLPKEKKLILCSNVLVRRKDFENGINRQLIKFYDHQRTENYNFNSCKHLA